MGMTKFSSNRSNLESRIEYGVTDCLKVISQSRYKPVTINIEIRKWSEYENFLGGGGRVN